MNRIGRLLFLFPLYSKDLRIDLTEPSGRFKWFLASILFGARISEKIASNTYRSFERSGIDTVEKIVSAGWDELVRVLDEGGYVRYDFSTATKLLNIMEILKEEYGSLDGLYDQSSDTNDLERRLKGFEGIGAVTTHIFLREMRGIWDVNPNVPDKVKEIAGNLDIDLNVGGEKLARIETALVKLNLRYCKHKGCVKCPMREYCKRRR
jgi:uncharacterized protein YfbU (UPF0304 family)